MMQTSIRLFTTSILCTLTLKMFSKSSTFWILSFFAGLGIGVSIPSGPTAKTRDSTYVGFTDSTYNVDIWAGIRYANPPIGPLRLQHPQPYDASGSILSQEYGNRCFEIGSGWNQGTQVGNNSEDCLVLNIYAPSQCSKRKRWNTESPPWPVMFYVHGGGYNQGSGNDYKGQSLVSHSVELKTPVIIVTINYRLSFFGFSGKYFHLQVHDRS
jgi:carboxylesterase type B